MDNRLGHTACHMLQQGRGLCHLALYQRTQVGIADGIFQPVGLDGPAYIIMYAKIDAVVTSHHTFLGQHAVKGIQPQVVDEDATLGVHC